MSDILILKIYNNPELVHSLTIEQWELLLRQAKSASLGARLYCLIRDADILKSIPEKAHNHLESAFKQAARQHQQVIWEVHQVNKALKDSGILPILLKGGAYIHSNAAASSGRTLSDIDILVKKADIKKAEMLLLLGGWITTKSDDYDKMYYREWTHEIPPIRHYKRGTVIDVHHNIFPVLNYKVDADKLRHNAIFDSNGIGVLRIEDMIIHSATHLFLEGNFENALRDLTDLDLLLKQLSLEKSGFASLENRCQELSLTLPVFYACRYSHKLLGTKVSENLLNPNLMGIRNPLHLTIMDLLFYNVLRPFHRSSVGPLHGLSVFILYWRGHFNRMPARILIPHLAKKALRSLLYKKPDKDQSKTIPH